MRCFVEGSVQFSAGMYHTFSCYADGMIAFLWLFFGVDQVWYMLLFNQRKEINFLSRLSILSNFLSFLASDTLDTNNIDGRSSTSVTISTVNSEQACWDQLSQQELSKTLVADESEFEQACCEESSRTL